LIIFTCANIQRQVEVKWRKNGGKLEVKWRSMGECGDLGESRVGVGVQAYGVGFAWKRHPHLPCRFGIKFDVLSLSIYMYGGKAWEIT